MPQGRNPCVADPGEGLKLDVLGAMLAVKGLVATAAAQERPPGLASTAPDARITMRKTVGSPPALGSSILVPTTLLSPSQT
jgi:hypothetical protein